MSSPLVRLRALFHNRAPHQPEELHADFKVDLPHEDDEHEADHSSPYIHVHRAGEVYGLEYETPRGAVSRRWVTIEGFKQNKAGKWFLYAYCFARKGVKSYSLDHVKAIFDHDGEPVSLSEIFPEGTADLPANGALVGTPGKEIIAAGRDGLCALTALAKIDGSLDDKEVDFILKYAGATAKKSGLSMSAEDTEALRRYIRNVQPTGAVVAGCLDRIAETDLATQKEFFWYAREVMDADGLQDEAEVEMILEISEALSHHLQ